MVDSNQEFCLRWSSFHQQLGDALCTLLEKESLVDVTLTCEGQSLKAHQTVLSAGSCYFQKLFNENTHPHPIVIFKDVKFEELTSVIKFMYYGEVNVENDNLQEFLKTAHMLQIKGLSGSNSFDNFHNTSENLDETDCSAVAVKKIKIDDDEMEEASSKQLDISMDNKSDDDCSKNDCSSQSYIDSVSPITQNQRNLQFDGLSQLLPEFQEDSGQSQYVMYSQNLQSQPHLDNINHSHNPSIRPQRQRVLWTQEQLKQLDTWYRSDRYPNGAMMCRYADILTTLGSSNLPPTRQNVDYWFQNRRRRDSHPDVVQQRERKKLSKSLWNNILLEQGSE